MADIVQTLFGVSPESYQQEQSALADQRAMQYAKLDPFQQANYAIGRGSYGLAGAIGGALGGQDPELQKISARNSIAKQIDFSDLNSISQGVRMLSESGDTQGAMQLQQILLSQQAKLASIGKDEAAAKRERLQSIPNDIQLAREIATLQENIDKLKGLPASPERDQALRLASGQLSQLERLTAKPETSIYGPIDPSKYTKESLVAFDASGKRSDLIPITPKAPNANIKEIGVAEVSRKPVYLDVNNDEQFVFDVDASGKQVRKPFTGGVDRTTAKVSATATQAQQDDFAKQLNKVQGSKYSDAIDLRDNAITAVKTFNTLGKLDDQGLISGSFAMGRVGATNLLNTLGLVTSSNVATLARSENYVKVAGDAILSALGGKLGAQISDSDREFIKGLVPQLENSAAARRQLIDYMRKKNVDLINSSTELIDYAENNKTLNGYKPKTPLPKSSPGIYSDLSDDELDKRIKAAQKKQ